MEERCDIHSDILFTTYIAIEIKSQLQDQHCPLPTLPYKKNDKSFVGRESKAIGDDAEPLENDSESNSDSSDSHPDSGSSSSSDDSSDSDDDG